VVPFIPTAWWEPGWRVPSLRPTNPIEKTTPSEFFRGRWFTFRDPLADENDRGPVTI